MLDGLPVRTVRADICDRRSIRRAMRGVDRVFHVAGTTSLAVPRDARSRSTSRARGSCSRRRCAPTSSASSTRRRWRRSGRRRRDAPPTRRASGTPARYGIAYVDSKHEAEVTAMRLVARGLPLVIVNPATGDRRRRSGSVVDDARAPLHAPADPGLRRRHAQHRRRRRRRPRAPARRRARAVGERYILGNRNFTLARLFADLGRLSGVEPPALKLPLSLALALAAAVRAAGVRTPAPDGDPRLRR